MPADAARVRQCQIQEELLDIQVQKLQAKKAQNKILVSILDVLCEIQQDIKPTNMSAVDLLNSMQNI
jgi:hypothetical protein